MKFKLEFDMDNDAFKTKDNTEVIWILHGLEKFMFDLNDRVLKVDD